MKSIIFSSSLFFSLPVWGLSFDWSGFSRIEGYYQNSSHHNYYASYHFLLQPKIHVIDGLKATGRIELSPLKLQTFSPSSYYRQTGFVFIYGENSKQRQIDWSRLFFKISQMYLDYESEFLKIRLGRAPYHFGLGMRYSASKNPFQHWMSIYNIFSLYLEYSSFYLQPTFLHQNKSGTGVITAGFLTKDWKLEALGQYNFIDPFVGELFGQYEQTKWGLKSSIAYVFKNDLNMILALEIFTKISTKIPIQLELKTGGTIGDLHFHPNYNVALLYWNRFMPKKSDQVSSTNNNRSQSTNSPPFQIAEGQIQQGFYFSPRIQFSFLNDTLKISPLGLFARDSIKKTFNYELDIESHYHLNESLYFSLIGGGLYTQKWNFALLTQVAVNF